MSGGAGIGHRQDLLGQERSHSSPPPWVEVEPDPQEKEVGACGDLGALGDAAAAGQGWETTPGLRVQGGVQDPGGEALDDRVGPGQVELAPVDREFEAGPEGLVPGDGRAQGARGLGTDLDLDPAAPLLLHRSLGERKGAAKEIAHGRARADGLADGL